MDGKTVTLAVEKKPRLVIPPSEIQQLRAGEARSVFDQTVRYWEVIAVPGANARARIARLVEAFPAQRVLVSINHESFAIDATPGLESGLIVGQFSTREAALAFSTKLGIATEWIPFDERAYEEDRRWYEKATKSQE